MTHDVMSFNKYQSLARDTAIYPNLGDNFTYPALGLCGEAGEVAEKCKKIIRDQGGKWDNKNREDLKLEISDVLWYCANLASEFNLTLEEIAQANIDKLQSRKDRGTLRGSGDNR